MKSVNPSQFLQLLEKENLSDRQAIELTESVLQFWQTKYKTGIKNNEHEKISRAHQKLSILTQALEKPPMPGGAKPFLKNLFLVLQP